MNKLSELQQRFFSLSLRDQKLVIAMTALLTVTFFYLGVWEPLHLKLEKQQNTQASQIQVNHWMQNAAAEVKNLKASGRRAVKILKQNSPVSIVVEQSANISGLKKKISKIESSGKKSAQIKIDNASFNQMLLWLNTLKTRYGINVSSAKIERTDKDGIINARLSLNRTQ